MLDITRECKKTTVFDPDGNWDSLSVELSTDKDCSFVAKLECDGEVIEVPILFIFDLYRWITSTGAGIPRDKRPLCRWLTDGFSSKN